MPYNTNLYPTVYTNICPTQAGEDPIAELRRQILILRNQQIAAARVGGQNTAELQNQLLTVLLKEVDANYKPPLSVATTIIINNTTTVTYPTEPGSQGPQDPSTGPKTPPLRERIGWRRAYFGGGFRQSIHGQVERVGLRTAVVSTLDWYLQNSRHKHAGVYSARRGYWCGGQVNQSGTATNDIEAIAFSSEARVAFATNLSTNLKACRGASSHQVGLIAGNETTGAINFITFRNEAVAAAAGSLSTVRGRNNNNQSPTHGYFSGGQNDTTTIEKIQFSDRAVTTASSTLSSARSYGATLNNPRRGYILGGRIEDPAADLLTIQRIQYSNDATSVLSNNLGIATSHHEGVSDRVSGLVTMNQGRDYKMREFSFKTESVKAIAAILNHAGRVPAPVTKV